MFINNLINESNSFKHNKNTKKLLVNAIKESFIHHFNNNLLFSNFYNYFNIHKIKEYDSIIECPPIFVDIFKNNNLKSVPDKDIEIALSSSGTGGKKSYIYLDKLSIQRIKKIVFSIFNEMGMYCPKDKNNYICFSYDPYKAGDIGSAFSDQMLTGLTDRAEVYYAIKVNNNNFDIDNNEIFHKFEKFEKSGLPIRILGFPSYIYKILNDYVNKYKRKFNFPDNSFIITGGGWKLHSGEEIPKEEFKSILADMLGIPSQNIRDHYGCVEHGIPYVDCEYGNLHIPIYSEVLIKDPSTLENIGFEKEGLIELISPYCNSYPSLFLLTSDKGILHKKCKCGRGKYIELKGRAGVKKLKGCGITASELLNKISS